MPALDVSELLTDPDFAERLTVYRVEQMVGDNGRATVVETLISPAPVGVVLSKDTAIGGNELERLPDYQARNVALDVYTRFRLRCLSTGGPIEQSGAITFQGAGDIQFRGSGDINFYGPDSPLRDFQPDEIEWNGDRYLVSLINDYSHYGHGFIHAECVSKVHIDNPPAEAYP